MNLCVKCKHFEQPTAPGSDVAYSGICLLTTSTCAVTGKRTTNASGESWAWWQRNSGWIESRLNKTCGREGRFFEAKAAEFGQRVIVMEGTRMGKG